MHRGILSALLLSPTNLAASEVTSDSVTLTWSSSNTEPVQSYIIQYKAKYLSDEYSSIDGVMTTQYTVSPIEANTAYEFRIVAVNDAGQSQPSVAIVVSTSSAQHIVSTSKQCKLTETTKGDNCDSLKLRAAQRFNAPVILCLNYVAHNADDAEAYTNSAITHTRNFNTVEQCAAGRVIAR